MKIQLLVLCTMVLQTSLAQLTNQEVAAKIETSTIDDIISISGTATNTTEIHKSLRYIYTVFRTDAKGNLSKNVQEGRFTLEANERKKLSQASVNANEKDKIIILLLIYQEDQIVAKDRLAFNDTDPKQVVEKIEEQSTDDGIELKGIVIEETKTKPGKDFYEFFYNSYTLNQINGSKIVGVYEKLSFGRTTIIQVKINDNVIHEFIAKPDLEYLEQMSKIAIRRVYKYFKDLKNQKNDIFQY